MGLEEIVVIDIAVEIGVVLSGLVETSKVGVQEGTSGLTGHQGVGTQVNSIVNGEVAVLLHVVVVAGRVVSATETLLLAALMHLPQLVNAIAHRLGVGVAGENGGRDSPEEHILRLELENS